MLAADAVLFTGVEAFARRRLPSFVASFALVIATAAICVAIIELGRRYWSVAFSAMFGTALRRS